MNRGRTCLVRTSGGELRELSGDELDELSDLRKDRDNLVWLDVVDPDADEIAMLQRELAIHPLAVEDLEKRRQRPKLDTYASQYVIVAYELLPAARGRGATFGEIHLIVGHGYLVSVHWTDSPVISDARARFRDRNQALEGDVSSVLYAVLDGIADGYFPFLDRLSERIDRLEERVVTGGPGGDALRQILSVKRELLELRRMAAPLRDVANSLLRRDLEIVDEASVPYYQDLYDHLVRVLDSVDLYRDLVAATLEASLSATSNNLNVIVKRLTSLTVILMVPTLIAGVYGMNFHFMPELTWPFGYVLALGVMAASMVGLAVFFRSRDWF
jgi:magnesium transporter